MHSCDGCVYLEFEMWTKGRIAPRCYAPYPFANGLGRVVDVPLSFVDTSRIVAPKWCLGKILKKEKNR